MNLNRYCFLISQNISADLKGPKVKYKLHYGRCTGPLFRDATRHTTSCSDNKFLDRFTFSSIGETTIVDMDLSCNNISSVSPGNFDPLASIKRLFLGSNPLSNDAL